MPLNKANFDGRAAEPSSDNIMWEVTFTVTDTTTSTGSGGTSQAQGGEVRTASFPISASESAAQIASALKDNWNSANPEYRAQNDGDDVVVFPDSASQQRYRIGNGEWHILGPSHSNLVDGVEVSDT